MSKKQNPFSCFYHELCETRWFYTFTASCTTTIVGISLTFGINSCRESRRIKQESHRLLKRAILVRQEFLNKTGKRYEVNNSVFHIYRQYRIAANKLAEVTGSNVVRILPAEPYSAAGVDWTNEKSRCTQEYLNQTLRPAIQPLDIDFSQYDTVFIGFPIWWHEEPTVIRTFLDNTDLTGKQLYPFCTSYESPMSEADTNLQKGYPNLNWHTGLRFPATPDQIQQWLNQ
jgi:hypothetical protein